MNLETCYLQTGDMETVKSLIAGVQSFGDLSQYSSVLFDCIDNKQTDIAKFLIRNGFKTDVWKEVLCHDILIIIH